ncbi:rhodanese-like domain-containing protein [Marinilactibacillus sp. XAAS-LB27]|uniref:rhodanese-like domain-containing protein n=1 Tax=Marinilactibacillus sp. XAAS-LB27 TaxID=3114538 RepID=UPI002E197798|nr:rhodanese-like domain-containing protein [Marinilactibacillus sp. XAAS-LB27]
MFSFFKPMKQISTQELKRQLTKKPQLIDVRTSSEFNSGHINGAINVPLNEIQRFKGKKDQPVYVVCQSGMRSKQASNRLEKNGYKVINVRGGMNQWKNN